MKTQPFVFHPAFVLLMLLIALMASPQTATAQDNEQDEKISHAVVRGKLEYDRERVESWDGNRLVVPYQEIQTSLRERVMLPDPPYPDEAKKWEPPQVIAWEEKFVQTDEGKKFLEDRKKLIENAHSFDIKFEKDGTFVIYDVPAGMYGIQGRVDKEIGGTKYGFEVFGQIEILEDVDELALPPMRVEVTPLMRPKQAAPPINVKTHDNKLSMNLETFGDDYLFVNFWTSLSPTAEFEQKLVQEMYLELKPKFNVRLLSINIDTDREKVLKYVVDHELKGSHGFTNGVEHPTIFDYGVRSFPSFWLIGKDDKILMSQYEIAQAMRVKPSLTAIISDRIEGKDAPTLAEKPDENPDDKKNEDDQ